MSDSPLPMILVLLAASVFVVALARRLGLPAILGYVTVGLVLGPHAAGLFPDSDTTHLLAELGVAVLLVALSSAWASHLAGLSMALGAFLAGMMLAESEYKHQVESVIRPFRDILLGLFFISVGMLLDLTALWGELAFILL